MAIISLIVTIITVILIIIRLKPQNYSAAHIHSTLFIHLTFNYYLNFSNYKFNIKLKQIYIFVFRLCKFKLMYKDFIQKKLFN